MSKKNYDSEFCGSLPLNFTNQIQSYGALVVLERETTKIIQVSQNIKEHFGIAAETAVGTLWENYIVPEQAIALKDKTRSSQIDRLPLLFTFAHEGKQTECLAIVHIKDRYLILEIEKIGSEAKLNSSFLTVYQDIKYVIALLDSAANLEDAYRIAIQELKRISGFDRIMIYRFDADWNGRVIAEILEEGMEPYLGLVFPASDVPRQARELYLKNPYRQIPDRDYTPVRLYPLLNPITEAFIDLSDCNLRSVAAVHVEYLTNMKVQASMSTRILKDDKLWGLISCHHRTPKFLSYEQCSVFELLSGVISAKISQLQTAEDFVFSSHLQTIQSRLLEQLYAEEDMVEGLLHREATLLELLHAQGAVIAYNRSLKTMGVVPSTDEVQNLIMWLQGNEVDKVFYTSDILSVYDNEHLSNHIAGFMAIPIHPERGEYVLAFRTEVIQEIQWGGNPDEAIRFENDKKNYHPRSSFHTWQQTVKDTSLPWHAREIEIAEELRNVLLEFMLRKAMV
jgi:light-regulated signal transduction histidine kinase (bacteriophytochrome)